MDEKTIKTPQLAAALILSAALAMPVQAQQSGPVVEAKAAIDKATTSFNSGDYKTYSTYVADDVEVFTGVYTPLLFVGKAQWMGFVNSLATFAYVNLDPRSERCRAYGSETVVCNGYFVFTTVTKSGVTEVQSGRESLTMVKQGGRWMVANMHFSRMFDR
ncbi:MAG: nuclear transport factor 2 family protein [Gemmatimonadaceae bacterium]